MIGQYHLRQWVGTACSPTPPAHTGGTDHFPACDLFWTNFSILAKLPAIIFTTHVTLETIPPGKYPSRIAFPG